MGILFIVNPAAGKGKVLQLTSGVQKLLGNIVQELMLNLANRTYNLGSSVCHFNLL
jgi:hypothetical protein